MYRLLLVDDEPHVVNWLVELFQSQQDMELDVIKAYTGMAALALLDQQRIDIMLLDIKMPGLSGLDIADRVYRNWPACKIIFLTGHSDFSYLYEVNRKGNSRYLLKTEDDSVILSAVRQAMDEIESRNGQAVKAVDLQRNQDYTQQLLRREILRRVLAGSPLDETMMRIQCPEWHMGFDASRPVYLMLGKIRWTHASTPHKEKDTLILRIEHLVKSMLDDRFDVAMLVLDAVTVACFLQQRPAPDANRISGYLYLKESLDGIVTRCARTMEGHVALLLYEKELAWRDTGIAFERMSNRFQRELHAEVFSHSFASIHHEADMAPSNQEDSSTLYAIPDLSENLAHHLNQGNRSEFMKLLGTVAQQMLGKRCMRHLHGIRTYQSIVLVLLDYITRYGLQDKIAERMTLRGLYNLEIHDGWSDAYHYLTRLADMLFAFIGDEEQNRNEKLIGEVKQYIRSHLDSDLSLTGLSNLFNYSSSYLSRVFSQTAGVSLTSYINLKRVDKAKELLQQTNANIQDVSAKVGFDSSQYFSIVFKKVVGTSPREFRSLYFPE
jgi:two-component system, response regulator YesN